MITTSPPTTEVHTSNLAYALAHATELGHYVFTIAPRSKGTIWRSHGLNDATKDPDKIKRMFDKNPNANLALNPMLSRLYVMDIDYRNGGKRVLERIVQAHGKDVLEDTPAIFKETGTHHYFAPPSVDNQPECTLSLPNNCGFELIGQLPIATHRGYVMVPLSTHPDTGETVQWAPGRSPWQLEARPLPSEILLTVHDYFEELTGYRKEELEHDALEHEARAPGVWLAKSLENRAARAQSRLQEYDCKIEYARAVCQHISLDPQRPFEPGEDGKTDEFRTRFRTDNPDVHPSGSIQRSADGFWRYHDFGRGYEGHYHALCLTWAGQFIGRDEPLPKQAPVTFTMWQTRALAHLGFIELPHIPLPPIPPAAPPLTEQIFRAFGELTAIQSWFYGEVHAVPYTWKFAADWASTPDYQLTEWTVRFPMQYLLEKQFIRTVAERQVGPRKCAYFLPAGYAQGQPLSGLSTRMIITIPQHRGYHAK